MNNVLELRGKHFIQEPKRVSGGGASMNSKVEVTIQHLEELIRDISLVKNFWSLEKRLFEGILISVNYNKIVTKSNQISGIFHGDKSNEMIVGARFNTDKTKHIITYYLNVSCLDSTIKLFTSAIEVLNKYFNGTLTKEVFDSKSINSVKFSKFNISKSQFKQVIADASYIESFTVEKDIQPANQSIITLYDVKSKPIELLKSIGIELLSSRILDNQTIFLDKNQLARLFDKAPYLVSMATVDLMDLSPDDFIKPTNDDAMYEIYPPTIEPVIGVIDTLFDESVYFSSWVEYHDMVDDNILKEAQDYKHGTAVSSIIVDGPRLNPWLDDGCGNFRVRHFGVAISKQNSSFTIIKQIKEIVSSNRDIKVWNISIGSNTEINDNFISAEAAVLDQLQFKYDVIFVVAGTNKPSDNVIKIGSPADSINSIVVNSVTIDKCSANYSRKGLALSFFAKPDVSYYGGSKEKYIKVCEPLGEANVAGTSFAAPWIARKLSFLIDIIGLNREVAKAMIIDSAIGWNKLPTPEEVAIFGHGIVPIKIDEIIRTKDDEIRFIVSDTSEKWNTYIHGFPIPMRENKYPYFARATMCYFPKCNRTQGVDYTNTELNIHFGRIDNKGRIIDIKGDYQNQETSDINVNSYILEGDARKRFRKCDNVKYIAESFSVKHQPKKSYENTKNWGMEIKTSNRLDSKDGVNIRFGVIVTLKEIKGVNRIDEFIKSCNLNGWIVNEIDIESRININQLVNQEIEFE